jgi:hypothetical protein
MELIQLLDRMLDNRLQDRVVSKLAWQSLRRPSCGPSPKDPTLLHRIPEVLGGWISEWTNDY